MFNNVLNGKKKDFLDFKKVILTVGKCPFFLRGYHMIFNKNLKIPLSLIFFERDLDMMFNNVLNVKKGFLDYKNVILT